jgi:DNA invertase Pin-like site-specific DNA recombinase
MSSRSASSYFPEALDLTTASGRALAGMLAVFAEFERDILRDRVKAGIAQSRQEGRPHGRPATVRRQRPQAPPARGQQERDRQAPERQPNLSPPPPRALAYQKFPFLKVLV